ncbi:hypothetical protein GWO43_17175, partial [candidate division KSB1 bacterium]|nr:hypothetical protein [candidate division KSB1 bacterium]NIR72061.1 hypothetical protein [candidate division KSB1 bacterium]NIS25712.1 hypothetical protein [candidate division KSB1 bacterium]NIT72571.1 hypothetical protein [candidate division KSB1 bacterium]NIU26397.1 hypothetical protein [candidate division KSB1 bacterium]
LYACEVVHARLCRIENEVDAQGRGWQITDKMRKQREQLEKKFLALTTKGDLK